MLQNTKNGLMMIRKIIFCALSLLVLLSCTQGDGDGMTDRHRTVTLHLSVSGFDGMESRAVTSFAKGATMYLDFRGMRTVATYDGTHWEMECPDGLAETTQGFCSVFYINNPKTVGSDRVEMSSGSIVYSAKNATYTNTIEKMDISATLKPEKSRLHFRGEPGTNITVAGVAYAESFSRQDYTVTDSSSPLSLTVAADGYTPYIYVSMLADRKLVVVNGDESYSRVFDSAVMKPGHSGYIDIPTDTSHDGWTIQQTDISGEDYGEEQNWNPKDDQGTHEDVEPTGDNYIDNGGFESWSDSTPTNWKSASTASSATLDKSTDAHGGSYSCLVKGDANSNKRFAYKEITLDTGTYTFSFYAKGTADPSEVRPGIVPVTDGKVGSYAYGEYATLSNSWTLISHTFTLDAKATICLVIMNPKKSAYSAGADVLIDDAKLTKASSAKGKSVKRRK